MSSGLFSSRARLLAVGGVASASAGRFGGVARVHLQKPHQELELFGPQGRRAVRPAPGALGEDGRRVASQRAGFGRIVREHAALDQLVELRQGLVVEARLVG